MSATAKHTGPVFITGVPRSGTSLTAGLIKLGGVHFGNTVPGNHNNETGFYEHTAIRNQLIKPWLQRFGYDRLGQSPVPVPGEALPPPQGLRKAMESLVTAVKGERWGWKEPKALLVWQGLAEAFPDARWVVTHRDGERILDSVVKTDFMRAYRRREEWRAVWLQVYQERLDQLVDRVVPRPLVVQPDRLVGAGMGAREEELCNIESFLGIKIPREQAGRFLNPGLWNRATRKK